ISKQIPLLIGYNKPDFWTKELFNVFTLEHGFKNLGNLFQNLSPGVMLISALVMLLLWLWEKFMAPRFAFLPSSFIVVLEGVVLAFVLGQVFPSLQLTAGQFVSVPAKIFSKLQSPDLHAFLSNTVIWKNAV